MHTFTKCAVLSALCLQGVVAEAPAGPEPPAVAPRADTAAAPPQAEKGQGDTAFENSMAGKVDARELLEQVMMARLSKELALDEQQSITLVRRFADFREQMREWRIERSKALHELKETIRNAQDEAAVTAQLEALRERDARILQMRSELFEEVSSEFTPWQRAKLYIFLSEFENDMRRMVQKARDHRAGDGEENGGRWDWRRDRGERMQEEKAPPPPEAPEKPQQ